MNGGKLLKVLLKVSEKAANIARVCRQDKALFALLVQEKSVEEKNPRFFQDFKTLADVLIQETIRHDIGIEFPELSDAVKGEENNVFSNTLGETITVRVCPTLEETANLLTKVLDGDKLAAELLSTEVHKEIDISDIPVDQNNLPGDFDINISDLGIWVDPIDGTNDYISGQEVIDDITGLHLSGLRCVTVLIGAYKQSCGSPVIGVVNQPFYTQIGSEWKGTCYWGLSYDGKSYCSISNTHNSSNQIVLISRTDELIKSKLSETEFSTLEAAGAGYKIICVILGLAAAYINTTGSTYSWDVCGPHAILKAQGADLLDYKKYTETPNGCDATLKYSSLDSDISNKGGLIAFGRKETLDSLKSILC